MNDGGSTLGGNQTGSGGTDALNSTDLKISHDDTPSSPITSAPDTSSASDALSISHDDSPNNSSDTTISNPGNPDDEHVPILPPSSGPARLFGQDISGITDEDLSSSATAQPIPTTIFPNSTASPEATPAPDTTTQPTDPTFNGVYTAQTEAVPAPGQTDTAQNMVAAPANPATIPTTPAAPAQPTVPYEQEFLASLHPDTTPKTKDTGDIILDPDASKRKTRKGLFVGIAIAAVAVVVLIVVAFTSLSSKNSSIKNLAYASGMSPESISETLSDENMDKINRLEQWVTTIVKQAFYTSTFLGKQDSIDMSQIDQALETYKNVYNDISRYDAVQYREDTTTYFTSAKQKMATMIPIYENIINNYKQIVQVLNGEVDISKITNLPNYDIGLEEDVMNFQSISAMIEEFHEMGCTDEEYATDEVCLELRYTIDDEVAYSEWNKDLRDVIVNSTIQPTDLSKDIVYQDLYSIKIAPNNKWTEENASQN